MSLRLQMRVMIRRRRLDVTIAAGAEPGISEEARSAPHS